MATHIKTPEDPNNLTDSERKHIPHISVEGNTATVVCGNGILHPMEPDHKIMFIELFQNGESLGKVHLKPGDEPQATFEVKSTDGLIAQALCDQHGIWESL